MAYKTTVGLSCANRQAALDEMWTQLAAMGWTLVDGNFTALTMAYTAVSVADDTFTTAGTVPANSTPCQITSTGAVPTGLAINTLYYIVNRTDTTFKLSATYNGAAINITAQGTGNHTVKEAFRVYKSNGENSDRIYEYMKFIYHASATQILLNGGYKYDTATHVLSVGMSILTQSLLTTAETGFYLWLYGSKNLCCFMTKVSSTYTKVSFGHFNKSYNTLLTSLTADATAGSAVTITVTSTAGFEAGYSYQIIGAAMEGRDVVVVTSITNSTQMVITTLPRNFATGSQIGISVSYFLMNNPGSATWYNSCPWNVAGLTDVGSASYGNVTNLFSETAIDPDYRTNKYLLVPMTCIWFYNNASTNISAGVYNDEHILFSPTVGLTAEDTFAIGKLDSGTSSGTNNTTSVFYDTSKSWTINAYANKVLIITFGTGIGQIKKIASNTATTLTLANGWIFTATPNATSQYIICDEGYRYMGTTIPYLACREGY